MAEELHTIAIFLNILASVVIFTRSGGLKRTPETRYLLGFIASFTTVILATHVVYFTQSARVYALLYGYATPLHYLLGPFSLFYVRSVLTKDASLRPVDALHFLPALVYGINMIPYYLMPHPDKIELMSTMLADVNLLRSPNVNGFLPAWFNMLMRPLLGFSYSAFLFWHLIRVRMEEKSDSMPQERQWTWLFSFTLIQFLLFGAISTALFLYYFDLSLQPITMGSPPTGPVVVTVFVSMIALSIWPHLHPLALVGFSPMKRTPLPQPAEPAAGPRKHPPSKKASATEREDSVLEEISHIMETRKPHCSPDFTIRKLADLSGIPAYKIKQSIRSGTGENWPHYRMKWRMKEVDSMLSKGVHHNQTIESIAEACGYEHRGTFYQHFREHFGMTPGEYIERLEQPVL